MTIRYRIKGMTCGGCVRAVTNAIRAAAPGTDVEVDLPDGTASVNGAVPERVVARAIADAGFEFAGRA